MVLINEKKTVCSHPYSQSFLVRKVKKQVKALLTAENQPSKPFQQIYNKLCPESKQYCRLEGFLIICVRRVDFILTVVICFYISSRLLNSCLQDVSTQSGRSGRSAQPHVATVPFARGHEQFCLEAQLTAATEYARVIVMLDPVHSRQFLFKQTYHYCIYVTLIFNCVQILPILQFYLNNENQYCRRFIIQVG